MTNIIFQMMQSMVFSKLPAHSTVLYCTNPIRCSVEGVIVDSIYYTYHKYNAITAEQRREDFPTILEVFLAISSTVTNATSTAGSSSEGASWAKIRPSSLEPLIRMVFIPRALAARMFPC